jgi:enediyne biosynthesis protein E4
MILRVARCHSTSWVLLACLSVLVPVVGCSKEGNRTIRDAAGTGAKPPSSSVRTATPDWFVDRAAETGLDFVHFNGMSGKFYDAEIFPPGVAMLDYDNDGDLDLYLVQGTMLGRGLTPEQALSPPENGSLPLRGRLYRNDLVVRTDGTRTLRFTDVTEQSGVVSHGYGMGIATGDYNNDGCVDVYLTNLGRNQMFRNNCDGRFTDVSKMTGTDDEGWSVSASFLDFDHDGWLDLFVGHYLRYNVENDVQCRSWAGKEDYCPPQSYAAEPARLYHNNGNGTFTEVTAKALQGGQYGPALGVVAADFNSDGWSDIYVANDGQEDLLWMNQHDGTFKNTAVLAGVALAASGKATASMGVDAGDFDNDGDEDLFHANLTGEGHTLFMNDGAASFDDVTRESGLGQSTLPFTGFGAAWLDFDNDGWLDLLTINGAVRIVETLRGQDDPFPFRQRPQLFRNLANGRFEDVTDRAGSVFRIPMVGRGAAFGDVDNDGDTDVLVANNNGRAQLLINQMGNRNHWVGLRLVGNPAKRPSSPPPVKYRDMLGARVGIVRTDGKTYWRRARSDGSYASANDPRTLIGLGQLGEPVGVLVKWPDGRDEEWDRVDIDRWTTLNQGSGVVRLRK